MLIQKKQNRLKQIIYREAKKVNLPKWNTSCNLPASIEVDLNPESDWRLIGTSLWIVSTNTRGGGLHHEHLTG